MPKRAHGLLAAGDLKAMRAAGFSQVACGPHGPNGWAIAEEWNSRWDSHRTLTGQARADGLSARFGAAFDTFRATKDLGWRKSRGHGRLERRLALHCARVLCTRGQIP